MSVLFNNTDIEKRYHRILSLNRETSEKLKILFSTDQILFSPSFINTVISIGECKSYNINDLDVISTLMQSIVFRDYVNYTDAESIAAYNKLFEVYFKAICKDLNKQHMAIKNKILSLLKINITIPSIRDGINITNPLINVSTTYTPRDKKLITTNTDIRSIIRNNFGIAISEAMEETFVYSAHPMNTELSGPVLNNLISIIISFQKEMLVNATACSVRTEPFISNSSIMNFFKS